MHSKFKQQSGMALPVSLFVLIAISALAVFGIERVGTELKIVGSSQLKEQLFNVAFNETEVMVSASKHSKSNSLDELQEAYRSFTVNENSEKNFNEVITNQKGSYKIKNLELKNTLKVHSETTTLVSGYSISSRKVIRYQFITTADINGLDREAKQEMHMTYEASNVSDSPTI